MGTSSALWIYTFGGDCDDEALRFDEFQRTRERLCLCVGDTVVSTVTARISIDPQRTVECVNGSIEVLPRNGSGRDPASSRVNQVIFDLIFVRNVRLKTDLDSV